MGGSIYKDKNEQLNKGPVFNVSASQNAEVEEELERRRRKREEQEKWMLNAPENKAKENEINRSRIFSDEETAKQQLQKDYIKITEPVNPWQEERFPEFSKELNDLLKAVTADNSRMSRSHFGLVKEAVSQLAIAQNDDLRRYYLDLVYAAVGDYIDRSNEKTNKGRLERVIKLREEIKDHKRKLLSERERVEKLNASGDKDAGLIVKYWEAIEILKTDTIRSYPMGDDPEELNAYHKEINGMGMMFAMQYNKLISACDNYLSKMGKPAVAREHYEKMKKDAEAELKIFNNALTDFLSSSRRREVTWGDALSERTGNRISIDTKTAKDLGAGTSTVFKVKRGLPGFDYFKEEETIGRNSEDCWNRLYNEYGSGDLSGNDMAIIRNINSSLRDDLKKIDNETDPEKRKTAGEQFYRLIIANAIGIKNFFRNAALKEEYAAYMTKGNDYKIITLLKKYGEVQPENVDRVCEILNTFAKSYNSYYIATNEAGIKEGSNLSVRNVATYRMAVALGIEESVARSETARIEKNKKTVYGNLMAEAKGRKASSAGKKKDKKYTSKCVCDMAMMQVFDLICGQIDRNGSNYYVSETAEGINSIKMIDNDMAFGNLKPDDLMKGRNAMPMFMDVLILTMPDRFRRRILEMDKKTMSFMLEDILSTEEINAAARRLEIIKNKIRTAQNQLDDMKNSDDKEERFEAYCMEFEEYRALNYQLELLKHKNNEDERFRKRELKTKPKISYYTYLIENNMLSEEELDKRIRQFKDMHKKDKWDGR